MRYFALFFFFFKSFKFSFCSAIKVASFSDAVKPFSMASYTSCSPNRVFVLILQLSNLLHFNCGTWNDIISPFAITQKLSENLEMLNAWIDLEHRKTLGGTRINFRSTINVVNNQLWSTQIRVGLAWFGSVLLGSTRWVDSISGHKTFGSECGRTQTPIRLIFTASRSSRQDLQSNMLYDYT